MTGYHPMVVNIPGHEGIGNVVQLGHRVSQLRLGQRVGIKWSMRRAGRVKSASAM